jgi:hypothetical protein
VDVDVIHKQVRRHQKAKKMIVRINGRWKQLDNLAKKYITEIWNLGVANLRQLAAKEI